MFMQFHEKLFVMDRQKAILYLQKLEENKTESVFPKEGNCFYVWSPSHYGFVFTISFYMFWEFLKESGWVTAFDWSKRYLPIGRAYLKDHDWVANAGESQIATFLYFLEGYERHDSSFRRNAINNGLMLKIFRRILELESIKQSKWLS